MRLRTIAPAKINWTLEVLGRREDGYHEIRSVMQTIDLCDEVEVSSAPDLLPRSLVPDNLPPGTITLRPLPHLFYYTSEEGSAGQDGVLGESVIRVVQLLDPEGRKDARVSLRKKIPVAAGLGGGSSDAAAALRALQRLWAVAWEEQRLAETAAQIGSDVSFFLFGGTALSEGRGERIAPLPDAPAAWVVLLVPPMRLPEKTKRMYQALVPRDFGDGSRGTKLTQKLRRRAGMREEDLHNAFDRAAYDVFGGLEQYREALLSAGANSVHLAGAGPTLFALVDSEADARELGDRIQAPEANVLVARTLGAAEATAIVE